MISYIYVSDFQLVIENAYTDWIISIIASENKKVGDIAYVFCDDSYLIEINQKYLQHDAYTDIITFDYTDGNTISGDIIISTERVEENALKFEEDFENELRRVMAHGILHLAGYGDKSKGEILVMRAKEEEKMKLFHVEQN